MKEYDQLSNYSESSPERLKFLQQGFQYQDFVADSQALMQTRHDPIVVTLQRLVSSKEFRIYYIISSILSIIIILDCIVSESSSLEIPINLLLYLLIACELVARTKLTSKGDYYKRAENFMQIGIIAAGFIFFLYQNLVYSLLILRILSPFIVLVRQVWTYMELIREDEEQKQTRARASQELSFDILHNPVQIEMETINSTK